MESPPGAGLRRRSDRLHRPPIAGKGGVFYPYGEGLAAILSKSGPGLKASAEATGGSVDNVRLLQAGKAQLGFTTIDSAFDAIQGAGAFAKDGKQDIRVLALLYDSYLHVVASDASGVTGIAGLKDKRVSIGSAGSSTEAIADRVLEAAGLDPKTDVQRSNLGVAESAAALKEGKIDAFFWIGGVPTAAVAELAKGGHPPIVFLPTRDEQIAIDKKFPGLYVPLTLPKTAYAGMTTDTPCLGVANALIVSAKAEDSLVEALLTAIFDNLGAIHKIHPEAARLTLATAAGPSAVPFHPAALAFYKAKGAVK
jgi:TRAP transporter TAXI family solute receptor